MFRHYYKALYRRVARLPLDHRSLGIAKQKLRLHFTQEKVVQTFSVVNRKLYDRVVSVFDSILVDEKYKDFDLLLSLIYRDLEPRPQWVDQLRHTRYSAFKRTWPQVHLIDEFADQKNSKAYHVALAKMQPVTEFLFVKALGISRTDFLGTLKPLSRLGLENHEKSESQLLEEVQRFHKFLSTNAKRLLDTQISMLEVCYKPNRYGLPPSIATMEAELKAKVNYAKYLVDAFRPLSKNNLLYLIDFVTSKEESCQRINPAFFQFMLRKRAKEENELSPGVQKYVRHKQLIPNERNIIFYYRSFVVRQFFIDENGEYAMSPMRNIYD